MAAGGWVDVGVRRALSSGGQGGQGGQHSDGIAGSAWTDVRYRQYCSQQWEWEWEWEWVAAAMPTASRAVGGIGGCDGAGLAQLEPRRRIGVRKEPAPWEMGDGDA